MRHRCTAERLGGLGAMLLLLGACSTVPVAERGNSFELAVGQQFGIPATSLMARRFETVVRQRYDFSCGSAALATLLSYHYADRQDEESVFLGMFRNGDQAQIRRLGFSLLDMKRYLASRGLTADGYRVTLDQIATVASPGIALIDYDGYKHFVVVKGIDRDGVTLGDPSLGLRRETRARFLRQWNGVYFAINPTDRLPRGLFNGAADRARAPGFRTALSLRPLDLAALELTRPQRNEF